jgi:hypothetical protein
MKKLFLTVLILPLMFSCSKTFHGCADNLAINFDEDAEKDDGSCLYGSVTFYADSTQYPATQVSSIIVTVDNTIINSFNTFYNGFAGDCGSSGTVSYAFGDAGKIFWSTRTEMIDGTFQIRSGSVTPDGSDCILVNSQINN